MQRQYDYAPGQKILKKAHNPTKSGVWTTGPYTIEPAHVNGMLMIELHPDLTGCINIHNVILYQ